MHCGNKLRYSCFVMTTLSSCKAQIPISFHNQTASQWHKLYSYLIRLKPTWSVTNDSEIMHSKSIILLYSYNKNEEKEA